MSNMDIARAVMAELATKAKVDVKGWRWAKGVVLFPDIRCPYCKVGVRTPAIWKHTEFELIGQVIPKEGVMPKLDRPRHAHLLDGGQICMGGAKDAYQALFGALNGKTDYRGRVVPFLQSDLMLFHECAGTATPVVEDDDEDTYTCLRCEDTVNDDDVHWWWDETYCNECFNEVAFNCYHCGANYGIDDRNTGTDDYDYCTNCWRDKFFECDDCNKVGDKDACFTSASDELVCEDCFGANYFGCGYCSETTANADRAAYEYDGEALCQYCFDGNYTKCEACDEVYKNRDGHEDCEQAVWDDWRESTLLNAWTLVHEVIEALPKGTRKVKRELLKRVLKHLDERYTNAPAETE